MATLGDESLSLAGARRHRLRLVGDDELSNDELVDFQSTETGTPYRQATDGECADSQRTDRDSTHGERTQSGCPDANGRDRERRAPRACALVHRNMSHHAIH